MAHREGKKQIVRISIPITQNLENKIEPICISLKEYVEMQSLFKINSQSYQIHRINHK
jgi:hypothetical protein